MGRPATKSKPAPQRGTSVTKGSINYPPWLPAVLLVFATVLAYQPVWHAGFIWDDDAYVTGNPTLRSVGGLGQIWFNLTATPQYYPLVFTTFWLEYHLWGLDPVGYHVVNVMLHSLAAVLLWRALVRLRLPGSFLAAAVFALHPVNVESAAWVTERKNVLSAVFYFAAALAYWRWWTQAETSNRSSLGSYDPAGIEHRTPNIECPKSGSGSAGSPARAKASNIENRISKIENSLRYFAALGLFIAALLSKTVTASLPAAILLVIWWKHGCIASRDVRPLLPFFGAGMALGLVTSWLERTHVGASGPDWAFSFADRCLIAGRAVWFYAGKLVWPANLVFIYPRWHINPGEWWQWLFPAAVVVVIALLWQMRARIGRGPLAAVLFFVGTLFPALGFANIFPMRYSFVADHFQYLASVGLIALAAAGLGKLRRRIPLAAALLPLGLAVLTWHQARGYADQETLWRDTLAKNPACWMADYNLGTIFLGQGRIDEAISRFQTTLRLKPDDTDTHNNLGTALGEKGEVDEAISQFQEAIRLKPDEADSYVNLGTALGQKGRIDEAVQQFEEAIRLKPGYAEAHFNLGVAFAAKGQMDEAIDQYQQALRARPDYPEASANLNNALHR